MILSLSLVACLYWVGLNRLNVNFELESTTNQTWFSLFICCWSFATTYYQTKTEMKKKGHPKLYLFVEKERQGNVGHSKRFHTIPLHCNLQFACIKFVGPCLDDAETVPLVKMGPNVEFSSIILNFPVLWLAASILAKSTNYNLQTKHSPAIW